MRSTTTAKIVAGLAAVALCVAHGLGADKPKKPEPEKPSAPKARSTSDLHSVLAKDAGYVEYVHVEIGSPVAKGELILSLDTDKFRHAYETNRIKSESKSSIAVATAEVKNKQAVYDSTRDAVRYRRADSSQLARAEADLDSSKAKLQIAIENDKLSQLEFDRAREQLDARFIRSPINGVLVDVPRKRGDNVSPGMVVARVTDPTRVGVSYQVTPEVAAAYDPGTRILLRRAGSDELQSAVIKSIFAIPGDDKGTQQMNLEFDDPEAVGSSEYELVPEPEPSADP